MKNQTQHGSKVSFMSIVAFLLLMSASILFSHELFARENTMIIHFNKTDGQVNRLLFGNNLIAYDPKTYEEHLESDYYGYSDYGAGIWDAKLKEPAEKVIKLAKDSGISALRFPGGCGTHHYDWKQAIGKKRDHFLYGLHEFLETSKQIGAEPVMTVSYFTGDAQDKADLVEYLNSPDDGKHKWAAERTKNGHKEPYRVQYFEIGNEIWHGDHRKIKQVLPEEYAVHYLDYYKLMKMVDPDIKIGIVFYTQEWNERVMEIIKDRLDFAIFRS